jgi:hypothetical protein
MRLSWLRYRGPPAIPRSRRTGAGETETAAETGKVEPAMTLPAPAMLRRLLRSGAPAVCPPLTLA